MSQQQNSNTHDQVKCFCLNQTCAHALTDTVPSACTKILSHIVGNCGHHCIVYQYRKLVCFRCCGISCNCCSTFLARPDFICGEYGSDVERRCFRPFLQNSAVPCILLTSESSCTRTVIQKLNETEALFDQKTFCYELKIKGLLCEIFGMILCEHQNDLAKFIPANQLELERLEQMLDYLNTHFGSVISLQKLADQVHLSREVCCRLFKKMTGKTITGYLEEYRVNQSLPLVQSCQYSMIQIADMTGFSNASRFARAFRRQFGCNPGEYNSLKLQKC